MLKKLFFGLLGILLLGTLATAGWLAYKHTPADSGAAQALQNSAGVSVQQDDWIQFEPNGGSDIGFIFYPGGMVDPVGYAPLLHTIAAQGFTTVLAPMPLQLAVLDWQQAAAIKQQFPAIKHWVIGGHSLGGVMAAHYIAAADQAMAGLVLVAAYPAGSDDLSQLPLPTLVIYGDQDRDATPAKVLATRPLLPGNSQWLALAGADHYQFGIFAAGTSDAAMTRTEQQQQTADAIIQFLTSLRRAQP